MLSFREKKNNQEFNLKKLLRKQLQLLSERSEISGSDIASLTHAMCELIKTADEAYGNY